MKKYYLIRIAYDFGFWSEEDQDFRGWLKATKYQGEPIVKDDLVNNIQYQLEIACKKKPCCVVEAYLNE